MKSNELRTAFLDYFAKSGHEVVKSSSLIPHDTSVMFTIAGMIPFKTYFTRDELPPFPRAASVQKCFRTVDIDIIGTTTRHLSFFEMLGNFSFGDYFKGEAIEFAWDFLTNILSLPKEKLWITVHESDLESIELWKKISSIPSDRIQIMGEDNFWKMGDVGPCGPCSEIYFDKGPDFGKEGGPKFGASDRYIEIWNLVFMQFLRNKDGDMTQLPFPSIDTGAGLERILPIVDSQKSVFDTDLFFPMIEYTQELTKVKYNNDGRGLDKSFRIIADHCRAFSILIADGVFPSNEGRGYVLRRIIRRLVKNLWQLGIEEELSDSYVDLVANSLGNQYENLVTGKDFIKTVINKEERSFRRTLQQGLTHIDEIISEQRGEDKPLKIAGDVAFKLYDTFGFPLELTVEIAEENGFGVDTDAFSVLMNAQRTRAQLDAKASFQFENKSEKDTFKDIASKYGITDFLGYDSLRVDPVKVLKIIEVDNEGNKAVVRSSDGINASHVVVLDRTPFYAEGGGQVGDQGYITSDSGRFKVLDTVNTISSVIKHIGYFESGTLIAEKSAVAEVDGERRNATMRNHTATHLLHHFLREVLGDHVRQQGSLVAPDRLRFDFSHFGPLTDEELFKVQHLCNREIISNAPVKTQTVNRDEAEKMGAIAFFGDKYGQKVRVVEAGQNSMEFCGGTHVDSLGFIGWMQIVSESSIGSNTRRIEAITGDYAIQFIERQSEIIRTIASVVKSDSNDIDLAVNKLFEKNQSLELKLRSFESQMIKKLAEDVVESLENGIAMINVENLNMDQLKQLAHKVKAFEQTRVALITSVVESSRLFMVLVSNDSEIDAGRLIKKLATIAKGGGGGNSNIASATANDFTKIDEIFKTAKLLLKL